MIQQQYPSQLLEQAVQEFAKLPGIGRKTALRLVLHLLRQETDDVTHFADTIARMRREVKRCKVCHNISDSDTCPMMAVENTQQFHGRYHVLGGVISPMDSIGPADLEIDSLVARVANGEVKEVILALGSTMEGDTTNFYIFRKLAPYTNVKISIIARGISVGDELEYTDEVTLGRSILNRTPFEGGRN